MTVIIGVGSMEDDDLLVSVAVKVVVVGLCVATGEISLTDAVILSFCGVCAANCHFVSPTRW